MSGLRWHVQLETRMLAWVYVDFAHRVMDIVS